MDDLDDSDASGASSQLEASLALESLGFKKDVVSKVLKTCTSSDTSQLVKEALKKLDV